MLKSFFLYFLCACELNTEYWKWNTHWSKKSQVIVICLLSFVSVRMQGTREENRLKVITEEADDTSIWTQVRDEKNCYKTLVFSTNSGLKM